MNQIHITEYPDLRGGDIVEPPLTAQVVQFIESAESDVLRDGTAVLRLRVVGADAMVSIGPVKGVEWFAAADVEYRRAIPAGGNWRVFARVAE